MKLHELSPAAGSTKERKRIGRGPASGQGKTAGKGHKGQKARAGRGMRPGFEGGQMPLQRRIPKRGFNNIFGTEMAIVNVAALEEAYEAGGLALRIDGYSQLFMMLEIVIQGVFYGIGRTLPPAIISITCNYLRIPMALFLVSLGWGLPGIWWSICITSILKGIIILVWFLLIKKKTLDRMID